MYTYNWGFRRMKKSNHVAKFLIIAGLLTFGLFISFENLGLKKSITEEIVLIKQVAPKYASEDHSLGLNEDVKTDEHTDNNAGLIETTLGAYSLTGIIINEDTADNVAIINGTRYKEGDYLSAFESDFTIELILDDKVIIHGALIVSETQDQTYELRLEHEKMFYVKPPVDVEPPLDWLAEQANQDN